MRILYLITRAEHGGAQSHLLTLLQGIAGRLQPIIGVGEPGPLADRAARYGARTVLLPHLHPAARPLLDLRAMREIDRAIREIQPDLVHAHSSKAGFLGRLAARRRGVPVIFTVHGWAFAEGTPPSRRAATVPLEWLAGRVSARIITVSEQDRRLALRYRIAPAEKLVTIRNGIADVPERAQPAERSRDGELAVVMVARFAPPKEHLLLLEAVAQMTPDVRLVLVGDGPLRGAVEARARALGIAERVTFTGPIGSAEVARVLAAAHVFALVSRWEGLPITILEAMRAGLPVVASRVGGVDEAVIDGETGFLIARSDAGALSDRLHQLLSSGELRARLGGAGRARYETLFTAGPMIEATVRLYEEVLGTRTRARETLARGFG